MVLSQALDNAKVMTFGNSMNKFLSSLPEKDEFPFLSSKVCFLTRQKRQCSQLLGHLSFISVVP